MIDPSYEEWLERREQLRKARSTSPSALARDYVADLDLQDLNHFTEAVLGPCPPEPMPICGRQIGSLRWACRRPENHPDACRPFLMDGDPPTEHVRRYGRKQGGSE